MTRIADLLAAGRTSSFEFFPPRTDDGERNLRRAIDQLDEIGPSFVSVTYGAGGSTRHRTHQLVVDLLATTTPMAHLTAHGHTRDELRTILERYRDAGVHNVLALRGDPPSDGSDPGPQELVHAIELVELAREVLGDQASIGVAAHPEGHPHSPDIDSDRRHLAAKLAAADFGVTQFFFRAEDYLAMVADLDAHGCTRPVLPGIMPITNVAQVTRFAELSGAELPREVTDRLEPIADQPDEVRRVGVEIATELCQRLLDEGAPGLHYYTLNRSTATREVHAALSWPS